MNQDIISTLISPSLPADGVVQSGIKGVSLFRATSAIPCSPAVYEPCVVAIASGAKEAVLDGAHYVYDVSRYLCCPMSLPVMAGTPSASPKNPLLGVMISLDQRVMTELTLEMEQASPTPTASSGQTSAQGIRLAQWDAGFSQTLQRLLELREDPVDLAVLEDARLRELYYAILKGEAGTFARQAYGAGNAIARSIAFVSANLNTAVSIDDMAARAGMSRAVFHRKFKQVTTMSPIQFVKSMRLNNAAMSIAGGMGVNEAAYDVGYVSASQFSREFKRMYGLSPRQWRDSEPMPAGLA